MGLQYALVYLLLISAVSCMKVEWKSTKFEVGPLDKSPLNVGSSYIFSLEDTPAGSEPPYVSINAMIKAEKEETLRGFVFIGPTNTSVGKVAGCAGRFRVDDNTTSYTEFDLEGKGNTQAIGSGHHHLVETTDQYQMLVYLCEGTSFSLTGEAAWFSPYGYLPGNIYMKLPVTGVLALCNLIVAIIYMVPMIRHRAILLHIHYGIFAVLAVGVIEVAAWYFYLLDKNRTGLSGFVGLLVVVFFVSLKRTLTRVLLLLMAMGVGVVKWTLGNTRVKIAILAVAYMCFSFLGEMIREMEQVAKTQLTQNWVTFCIYVPIALLDTCFYYWIILSIVRTMQQLTLRRQTLKLDMYKWFGGVLAMTGALAVAFGLYLGLVHFFPSLKKVDSWKSDWVQDMYWEFLFFFTMSAVCFLWRPRANNTRYGYAEFFVVDKQAKPTNVDDEAVVHLETLEVVSGGQLSHRRRNVNTDETPYQTDREKTIADVASTLSPMDQTIINATEYFDLPDDDDDEGNLSLDTQLKKLD